MSEKPTSRRRPRLEKAQSAPKRSVGRPSKFSAAVLARIVAGLESGQPLMAICREEGMPGRSAVYRWGEADATIYQAIARARDLGFDAIAEQALEIADREANSAVEVAQRRLAVETRLKLLAKWCPKRFGDKVELEHSGKVESDITVLTEARRQVLIEKARRAAEANRGEGERGLPACNSRHPAGVDGKGAQQDSGVDDRCSRQDVGNYGLEARAPGRATG